VVIPDRRLVDLENERLHVFTAPSDTGYLEPHSLTEPGLLATAALPGSPVGHIDDLSVDELHPIVGTEDPRLAHAVEVVYGQPVPAHVGL
jgi:hypothetical protein